MRICSKDYTPNIGCVQTLNLIPGEERVLSQETLSQSHLPYSSVFLIYELSPK